MNSKGAKNAANRILKLSAKQISDIWYSHSDVIAKSGNVIIAKSLPDSYRTAIKNPVVLKVLNPFNSEKSERHELIQEIEIYRHLQKKPGWFILYDFFVFVIRNSIN